MFPSARDQLASAGRARAVAAAGATATAAWKARGEFLKAAAEAP